MKRVTLLAAALLATSGLQAQTILLSDSFDAEGGSGSTLNYASFANWNVGGVVDLVRSGDFGISCVGGSGKCVDLDGSTGAGTLTTKTAFAFSTGDRVIVAFMASGSQRSSANDFLGLTLNFSTSTTFTTYTANLGGTIFGSSTPFLAGGGFGTGRNVAGTDPFAAWTFEFIAGNAGTFTLDLNTTSNDAVGPIIDNVTIARQSLNQNVVPEPATWTLMLSGLGLLGAVARRRRTR